MIYVFVFAFGAVIGSFLNVVICRYNTSESIIKTGSRCFSCGKKLSWFELIPIFSFLVQKGRCRGCGSRISWQYPIVEFITGLVFLLTVLKIFNFSAQGGSASGGQFSIFNFQTILNIIFFWIIFSLLIIISVYDLRHQIIPNVFVYSLIALSFFSPIITRYSLRVTGYDYIAGLAFFSFFGLLWLVSKGKWMGLGDAKIALAAGWLLGLSKGLMAAVFSFWIGALAGIFLLLFSSKNFTLKSRIPFGPFLGLGMAIAILFGSEISQFYFNIIF